MRYALPVPPLTGTTGNTITGFEGSSTGPSCSGHSSMPTRSATVADFTTPPGSVVVNWGDGSAPQTLAAANLTSIGTPNGVVWTVNAAHTYTEEGTFAYTVKVIDVAGASTVVAGSATIADAALTAGCGDPADAQHRRAAAGLDGRRPHSLMPNVCHNRRLHCQHRLGRRRAASTGVVVATATPGVFDIEARPHLRQTGRLYHAGDHSRPRRSQVVVTGSATVTDLAVTGSTRSITATEGVNAGQFALATFTTPTPVATIADVNATLAVGGWGDGTPTPRALCSRFSKSCYAANERDESGCSDL